MAKKKKKRRLRARSIWLLVIGYTILGVLFTLYYLNAHAPDPTQVESGASPMGLGSLFPIIVILWPLFLIIHIIQVIL